MTESVTGRRLKTTQASLEILSLILEYDGLTLAELDTIVDSSKNSICGRLDMLLESRYLVKHDGVYCVSFRVALLGERARHRYPSDEAVERVAGELADATGQEASFTIFEHGRLLMCYGLLTDEGRDADGIRYRSEYHLHNTTAGRTTLSELDCDGVASIVDCWGLPRKPEGTVTNVDRLLNALDEIVTQEYAVIDEEFAPNLIAVDAPIHDGDGRTVGGLSVGGSKYQVDMMRSECEFADELLNVAGSLEVVLL